MVVSTLRTFRFGKKRTPYRHGDRGYNAVFLGWNRKDDKDAKLDPWYSLTLPEGKANDWKLSRDSKLVLSIAAVDQEASRVEKNPEQKHDDGKEEDDDHPRESPDFTVELTGNSGSTVKAEMGRYGTLLPPIQVRFTKLALLDQYAYEKSSEPVFQTISIPINALQGDPGFDPALLKTIRLRFNRTKASVILLSRIGFE